MAASLLYVVVLFVLSLRRRRAPPPAFPPLEIGDVCECRIAGKQRDPWTYEPEKVFRVVVRDLRDGWVRYSFEDFERGLLHVSRIDDFRIIYSVVGKARR